jgi:hypothetical protein
MNLRTNPWRRTGVVKVKLHVSQLHNYMEISKQLHAPAAFGKDGWRNSGVVARK